MDRIWRLAQKSISNQACTSAAERVAAGYEGVLLEVDREADDCFSVFFKMPVKDGETAEVELSVYDLGGGQVVLSQEPDAGQNNLYWDEACQLAEDLAEELDGESVVL